MEKSGKMEKTGENSGPLTSFPVNRLNSDQLQHQHLCQKGCTKIVLLITFFQLLSLNYTFPKCHVLNATLLMEGVGDHPNADIN